MAKRSERVSRKAMEDHYDHGYEHREDSGLYPSMSMALREPKCRSKRCNCAGQSGLTQ